MNVGLNLAVLFHVQQLNFTGHKQRRQEATVHSERRRHAVIMVLAQINKIRHLITWYRSTLDQLSQNS
jgi:hypothetical protein